MQDTEPNVTHEDKYTLDNATDLLTRGSNTTYVVSQVDGVWAVITCGDDYDTVLGAAVGHSELVVHKADRQDGQISVALQKYADELN